MAASGPEAAVSVTAADAGIAGVAEAVDGTESVPAVGV